MLPFPKADGGFAPREVPPLDGRVPEALETATFANG
jgi:hypothetical protein